MARFYTMKDTKSMKIRKEFCRHCSSFMSFKLFMVSYLLLP